MREGFLGGTFDPVHQGHLDLAEAARAALNLDRVVFVPARIPSHRGTPHASAAHRFAMTALATEPFPHLLVSDLEMEEAAPSYTVITLDRLAARGTDVRGLFVLTGADAFADIRTWKDYPAVLDRCHFVAVSRPGFTAARLPGLLPELAGRMRQASVAVPSHPAILLVDAPTADVSATDVRRRAAADQPLTGFVPEAVARYIRKHRLYSETMPKGLA
jgi:nicotinate-nucleotide adenylyltransferase